MDILTNNETIKKLDMRDLKVVKNIKCSIEVKGNEVQVTAENGDIPTTYIFDKEQMREMFEKLYTV